MKVILLSHIKNVGQKGEVLNVSDGYFQNFLLPRRLAIKATDSQVEHMQNQQSKAVEKLENMKESAQSIKERIDGKTLNISEKAGESGKLYASLREKEVAAAILKDLKVDLSEKHIHLSDQIKSAGSYAAEIDLFKGVKATININVTAA
ncbi:MAG: 50S ribosomal protein L9 [Candidatus Gracilibacteria bacterium]|jgi:large subunit ribosomal protein L9